MFDSLFNVRINWIVLIVLCMGFFIVVPGMSVLSFIGVCIALHQLVLLFYSLNHIIPIRYLTGALMSVQMLVGPAFAYNGVNEFQYFKYRMQVPAEVYYTYAIPACILFIAGLHLLSKLRGERVDEAGIQKFVKMRPMLMYWFIGLGFLASFFVSGVATTFGFVFYLISGLKFVGAFLVILGLKKFKLWPVLIVFGSIIIASLQKAMFHDLITWTVFLAAVLCIKFKPPVWARTVFAGVFLFAIVVLQQVKSSYRDAVGYGSNDGGIETFSNVIGTTNTSGGLFDENSLAKSSVRINQGFIVTHVMKHVPAVEPYANGAELYKIMEAAILPRFIAPNKLNAGDNTLVYQFAGIRLNENTSMSLSALGDGYANFGLVGGCIFMFFLGLLFNAVLIGFYYRSLNIPILITLLPLVYYYPIRPDTALQTSLGHLFKASFVILMILHFFGDKLTQIRKPRRFYVRQNMIAETDDILLNTPQI